jgi:DNA-binding MarR family transcriptional regulator
VKSNEEPAKHSVQLSGRDLSDASRLLALLLAASPAAGGTSEHGRSVSSREGSGGPDLQARAAEELKLRRVRSRYFPPSIFGEAAWDLLLVLYVNDGVRFSTRQLIENAGLAHSTGLRWVDYLAQQGLVARESHPTDLRTMRVSLSERARTGLNSYFSETLTTGQ